MIRLHKLLTLLFKQRLQNSNIITCKTNTELKYWAIMKFCSFGNCLHSKMQFFEHMVHCPNFRRRNLGFFQLKDALNFRKSESGFAIKPHGMTLTVPSCVASHASMYARVMREICLLMHSSNSSLSSSGVKMLITRMH